MSYEKLTHLVSAGATVIHIASYEWERVRGWAIGLANTTKLPLKIWSQSQGVMGCNEEGKISLEKCDKKDPLEILQAIYGDKDGCVWILEDFQPFLREEHHPVLRWIRELVRLPATPKKVILLSTPLPSLPLDLRKEVPTLEISLPGTKELQEVLNRAAEHAKLEAALDESLVDAACGLTVMEARLAYGTAAAELGRLDHSAVALVSQEKERIIKQSEVLEYYRTEAKMAEVGGLSQLKEWLEKRGRAFGAEAKRFGLEPPKGVLLLGVQGCGKSLLAKAVAATWQFPLLRFDLGKVFGGIVGQSEGNIRNALQVAEALAPCVLWIDEIEKGMAGMGSSDRTDGGTTARVVGTLLTWMQEKKAPVFVVATANRIDLLPPELLRKGRFDEIFFVDLPTASVREDILAIHLEKRKRSKQDFELKRLAGLSKGFSGAELEEAVREGMFDAFAEGKELKTEHISKALEKTFPLSRTMGEQIEGLRQWAKVRARLASGEEPEALPDENHAASPPKLKQETMRNPFIPNPK